MLVRLFLTFWATGVRTMNWHAHLGGVESADYALGAYISEWGNFSSMGLRNELWIRTLDRISWDRSAHAWRRPSWYSFRRLVALTNRASSCEVLESSAELMVLRLVFRDTGLPGYFDAALAHRYAYVAWVDYKTSQRSAAFELETTAIVNLYERLPMVPTIDARTRTSVDAFGYPTGELVSWDMNELPHDEHVLAQPVNGAGGVTTTLRVTVYPSVPATNPGPLVLLTSAEWIGRI